MARRDDVEPWSLDECHFQRRGTRCRMWVPPEDRNPAVLQAPTRESAACFGAVSLRTGKFVHAFSPKFNAVEFEKFLKLLLRRRTHGGKVVVVLDNARCHHAKMLKPFLKKRRAQIELLFLPPYSPELAPIERVWKLVRRLATHNQYFEGMNELLEAVESCFAKWRKPNETLRRLCGII